MSVELRSRITLFLPAPTTLPQHFLIEGILTGLMEVCGGVTVSSDVPPVFTGSWIRDDGRKVDDTNLLVLADAPMAWDDPGLLVYLERLKLRSQQAFAQDLVWVTVHEVQRIIAYDPAF